MIFCVPDNPCNSSDNRAPGKKSTAPIYKILVGPGRQSNAWPTSTEADVLITRPWFGSELQGNDIWKACFNLILIYLFMSRHEVHSMNTHTLQNAG